MSHNDCVNKLPDDFIITAKTDTCDIAAFENEKKTIYALQFHPEVKDTEYGDEILGNFIFDIF